MITTADLEVLLDLAKKATQGKWDYHGLNTTYEIAVVSGGVSKKRVVMGVLTKYGQASSPSEPHADGGVTSFIDAQYIALANPTFIAQVVEELLRMRRESYEPYKWISEEVVN